MSWPLVKLKDVTTLITCGVAKRPEYVDSGIPFLSAKNVKKGTVIYEGYNCISQEAHDALTKHNKPMRGDILYTRVGSVGEAAIIETDIEFSVFVSLTLIKVDDIKLFNGYLKYLLNSEKFKKIAQDNLTGIGVGNLNVGVVREYLIPLPSIKEQKRIATILDKADAIRRKRQQAIDLTDQLLRSIFLEMFGDPVMNPKGWDVVSVGEVTDCIVPGRDKPKSFSGDTSWVTTKDLEHLGITMQPKKFIGLSNKEIKEVKAKVVPENSVLMTCVGDLGLISIAGVPMVINQQLHAFQCGQKLDSQFLMFALSFQKGFMLKMASSTTVPYMNKTVCNSVPVIIPPVGLQNEFSKVAIKIRKSLQLKSESEGYLLDLFSSLTQQAFNGELSKATKAA